MAALEPAEAPGTFRAVGIKGDERWRFCQNSVEHGVCNWAVPAKEDEPFCVACRLNHVIPDLSDARAKDDWHRIELAKRRLLFSLLGLGLPVESKRVDPARGLAFDFLKAGDGNPVFTGHSDGLITINIAEAEDPFREQARERLGERYRTMLGHFRHESGHYYWDRLVDGSPRLEAYRELFGDERASYDDARKKHYDSGGAPNWWETFVSAYASMHPWEDWAETWAHYLHMFDGLQTARSHGLSLVAAKTALDSRGLDLRDFDDLIAGWVPLTVALNDLNRSFGMADAYPFVLTDAVVAKLRFVHDTIAASR